MQADEVIAGADSLDQPGAKGLPLRYVLLSLLHEYARHDGHADLLRKQIDGATGV